MRAVINDNVLTKANLVVAVVTNRKFLINLFCQYHQHESEAKFTSCGNNFVYGTFLHFRHTASMKETKYAWRMKIFLYM